MQLSRIQRSVYIAFSPSAGSLLITSADTKVVYRRYASLFFIAGCSSTDNELITLEVVHRYVEQMDKYYGNVCELDIIFNFQKAYFILDELLLAGEMQESSKKNVLRCISQEDSLEDMEVGLHPMIESLPSWSTKGHLFLPVFGSFLPHAAALANDELWLFRVIMKSSTSSYDAEAIYADQYPLALHAKLIPLLELSCGAYSVTTIS